MQSKSGKYHSCDFAWMQQFGPEKVNTNAALWSRKAMPGCNNLVQKSPAWLQQIGPDNPCVVATKWSR